MRKNLFVPGILIRHYNACISPTQEPIPHIMISYKIANNKCIKEYMPNVKDYYDYEYLIQQFINHATMKQ